MCFIVTEGKTYDISNILIQIEKGSVVTSYEPYTGGIPSPSPDYPQEIKSVVNPTVKLSNEDGTKSQTVTLSYTLNAIPVSSGGNVTIDGQQYIADYVDAERGKLVRMVDTVYPKSANDMSIYTGIKENFATLMLQRGTSITEVQKILGHVNINTTMIYAKVSDADIKMSHMKYAI